MKKLVMLAVATVFMCSASVMAQSSVINKVKETKVVKQTETTVVVSAKARAEKMAKDLKLTDAQKTQVTSLFTKQDASVAKLKAESKVGSADYKTKLAAIQKSGDEQIQNIVGKDKFQQYQGSLKAGEQQVKEKTTTKIKSVKTDLKIK
ncbi:MAG: Spy/CpxP family protein refolding chaperone [Bacteroidota bacterium]|nr:Spy/CpxP family protein refolding chaperone [Bacteroidota bacterium]